MGRVDSQTAATGTPVVGRLSRTTAGDQSPPILEKKKGNFITNTPDNLGALFRGEIPVSAIVKEVPGVAKRGAVKTAETLTPAASNFVRTTGGIIGEGLAYASSRNVREQYKAGNLDILPTITKTTQKGLLKDTFAAGLEASILRGVPGGLSKKLLARGGIGALEGIGFAVAEGLAKDQSVEEILDNAKLYGVAGSALNVVLPWLGPLLRKQIGKTPQAVKEALKSESQSIGKSTTEAIPGRLRRESPSVPDNQVPTQKNVIVEKPQDVTKIAPKQSVPVQSEQIPIGGPTKGASRLEARLVAEVEDPAYQAGVSNYAKYSKAVDAPEITGATNAEQIKRASRAVDRMSDADINAIASGVKELPEGVLRTAFLKAASEKAVLAGNSKLVNRLGRVAGQLARRFGQEIQFTKTFDPLDPVTNIADILSVRLQAAERRLPKGETVQTLVKKASQQSTESQLKIQQAEALLDSILC